MARKKKHEEHVNHERWLISYADFITLLFATFVALYALGKNDNEKAMKAAESMRISFGAPSGAMIPQEPIREEAIPADKSKPIPGDTSLPKSNPSHKKQAGVTEFEEMKKEVEEYAMTKGMLSKVEVQVQERGLVISLKEAGFFESGKGEMKPESERILAELSAKLSQYKNGVRVEGHTDNVPISSRNYPTNWELSAARATNVTRLLVERYHVPAGKISSTGYGEFRPVSDNNTPAGRTRNRRVDLVVLSTSAENAEPETPNKGGSSGEPSSEQSPDGL